MGNFIGITVMMFLVLLLALPLHFVYGLGWWEAGSMGLGLFSASVTWYMGKRLVEKSEEPKYETNTDKPAPKLSSVLGRKDWPQKPHEDDQF